MPDEPAPPQASEHGLKANAIGFVDALVIGLASTAPAYSLAAVIGSTNIRWCLPRSSSTLV